LGLFFTIGYLYWIHDTPRIWPLCFVNFLAVFFSFFGWRRYLKRTATAANLENICFTCEQRRQLDGKTGKVLIELQNQETKNVL
jgi:hypothetical protein